MCVHISRIIYRVLDIIYRVLHISRIELGCTTLRTKSSRRHPTLRLAVPLSLSLSRPSLLSLLISLLLCPLSSPLSPPPSSLPSLPSTDLCQRDLRCHAARLHHLSEILLVKQRCCRSNSSAAGQTQLCGKLLVKQLCALSVKGVVSCISAPS